MEWVETTGPTVDAALDAALDELGVDEADVEFDVLQEPKAGLFGRIGGNPARVRARVKPISREKPGERNRARGRGPRRGGGREGTRADSAPKPEAPRGANAVRSPGRKTPEPPAPVATADSSAAESPARRRRRRGGRAHGGRTAGAPVVENAPKGNDVTTEEIPIGEQADVADDFMRGLVAAFGIPATVTVRIEDDA